MGEIDSSAGVFLREIQREFLDGLPGRVQEMERLWSAIAQSEAEAKGDDLATLHRQAHTMAGEGATFGFLWVSQAAQAMESSLKTLLDHGTKAREETVVLEQLEAIRRAAFRYSRDDLPDLPNRFSREPVEEVGEKKLLFVVDDDSDLAKAMAVQLRHYGYQVEVFNELRGLRSRIRVYEPVGIVMDIVLPEGELAGADFIADLRQTLDQPLKVVFVSVRSDTEARLQAYRAGGDAFFTKPVDVNSLAEQLDVLTGRRPARPYEILIVDDNREVADLHARELRQAGMNVTVIVDPLVVFEQIDVARPDLILLDVYMPGCSGPELAAMLRQHESYLSIPIVFLSREGDFDQQVSALGLGGDDFLTKPIDPEHLLSLVTARARHGRLLGSRIWQDGLTGLMNHSKQKEQLQIELKRASRNGSTLSFVMLDLDDFKAINDTYGHATGDRVLRSVAGILKKRLRETDVSSRYGGDEFAVVLPGTSIADARTLFEEITASFSQLSHIAGDQRFTTTISCGLSSFPEFPEAELLTEAADQALYRAKCGGKGRVEVEGDPDRSRAARARREG
ncbi:MAG: diguanylate cyclase [Acidobacteriota bacterium]